MNSTSSGLTTFEIIDILAVILSDRTPSLSPMLWGPTGGGKSAVMRQAVEKSSDPGKVWAPKDRRQLTGALELFNNWGMVDLRTALMEPTDLRGLPDLKGDVVRWVAPDELPFVGQEDRFPERGVVFLDEITHAQPAMQSACFSLVLDRRCGPHRLMPGWRIVAASNYQDENGQAFPMSAPLRTRFQHFHMKCSLEAFKRWGLQHGIDARIIAFLNWNPDYLHKPSENADESFPTPRTWESASHALSLFGGEAVEPVIAASVGPGTATVFCGFLALSRSAELNVDIGKLLSGKARPPELTPEKPDLAWAFVGRITAHVREHPDQLSAAIGFFCSGAWKDTREIGCTGLSDLKHLADLRTFATAFAPHAQSCLKAFGRLLE
jgi:hypothetical protein